MLNRIFPFIILSGLIILFFLRLFYPSLSLFMIPDFGESDVLHLNLPLKYILSESLKNKQWPLWTPLLTGGFPILAEGQIGAFYLPNLLLFRFLPLVWAYNLNLILAYFLAALGTYLFASKINLSKTASFFAAFIFTFSGFLAVHLNHFNLIQAASMLPLIFWATLLLWQKPSLKYSILLAFFLAQQIFTGHFYIVFITLFGLILFFIFYYQLATKISSRFILSFILSLVAGFSLSAIQLLPTIELWQLSQRQGGLDFNTVTDYPYPIKHLITFVAPYFFGNPANGSYPPFNSEWGIFWENTGYVGLLPLIFVIISFFFLREKLVKTFLLILFVSLLLVLGRNSPIYFVFSFPPFNFFRVPSKFLLLSAFSISILSAFIIDRSLKVIRMLKFRYLIQIRAIAYICIILFLFVVVIDEYLFSYNYPPATPSYWWLAAPESTKIITEKEAKISSSLAPYSWNEVFKKEGWQDMKPYVFFKNSLYPNYNVFLDIKQAGINTGGLIPRRVSLFSDLLKDIDIDEQKKEASMSTAAINALSLASVTHIISPFELKQNDLKLLSKLTPNDKFDVEPFYIYQNPKALPRFYLNFSSKKIDTVEEFYNQLSADNFLKDNKVLVENDELATNIPTKPQANIEILNESLSEALIMVNSDIDAILVNTDTNYPGWKAYVNGEETKIFNVNLTQRGIFFPKGQHKVRMVFDPPSFNLGKSITYLSMIIISAVLFLSILTFPRKVFGRN